MIQVPPKEIREAWPLIDKKVERLCERSDNGFNSASVKHMCENGLAALWLFDGGFCVVRVITLPRFRVLDIFLLGGSGMERWIEMLHKALKVAAADHQCKYIQESGRKGWLKRRI